MPSLLREQEILPFLAREQIDLIEQLNKKISLVDMLETGNIARFPKVGNFTSYCRCVRAKRSSNSKCKGSNNRKNGNKHLAWAIVEASHCT